MKIIELKIVGLGHTIQLSLSPLTTIGDVKAKIESFTGCPALYQHLLWPRGTGKKAIDDKDNNVDEDATTLEQYGVSNRTRVMILHNKTYSIEGKAYDSLVSIGKKIDKLVVEAEASDVATTDTSTNLKKDQTRSSSMITVSEMITRLCCELDAIDMLGSAYLRSLRRSLLSRVESIDGSSSESSL